MADAKWKDHLLKSSLPLEVIVAETLGAAGFEVFGEFAYERSTESGEEKDFSVDLDATVDIGSRALPATLRLLVECKYAHDSVTWIFAPLPTTATVFTGSVLGAIDGVTPFLIPTESWKPLEEFEENLHFCMKGIALLSGDVDKAGIAGGLQQLRHAMPHVVAQEIEAQLGEVADVDCAPVLCGAILATTAPLRVLRSTLSIDDVKKASSLDEISESADCLVYKAGESPTFHAYARRVASPLDRVGRARSSQRRKLLKDGIHGHFLRPFLALSQTVLVVTQSALPTVLGTLTRVAKQVVSSMTHELSIVPPTSLQARPTLTRRT